MDGDGGNPTGVDREQRLLQSFTVLLILPFVLPALLVLVVILHVTFVPAFLSNTAEMRVRGTEVKIAVTLYNDNRRFITIETNAESLKRPLPVRPYSFDLNYPRFDRTCVYLTSQSQIVVRVDNYLELIGLHPLQPMGRLSTLSGDWSYLGAFDFAGGPGKLQFFGADEQASCT